MLAQNLADYLGFEDTRREKLLGSNIPANLTLVIDKLLMTPEVRKNEVGEINKIYSITSPVEELRIDEHGIIGERHHSDSGFRASKREGDIYPSGSQIRQSRHLLVGTTAMSEKLGTRLGADITPELLGWNILLARPDGESVCLDGLPEGTNFMIFPEGTQSREDVSKLIVNLKLTVQQMGCAITKANIAQAHDEATAKKFIEESQDNRGTVMSIEGPVGEHILKVGQRVFLGLSDGYIH